MSERQLTDEQQAALQTHGVPITVDAGAGCGKTFVLTERFLSHLEPDAPDDRRADLAGLAAITFTDAAAREMRARVRSRCRERLAAATGESVAYWRSLLRRLDSARVSTIHAFASALVREHALELGVDPGYAVVDPAEADALKSRAIDDTLRLRLRPRDGQVDRRLVEAAALVELRTLRSRVGDLVDHAGDQGFDRWRRAAPDDAVDAWRIFYRERVAPEYARDLLGDPDIVELQELLGVATPASPVATERVGQLREALADLQSEGDPDDALKRLHAALEFTQVGSRKHVFTKKDWPDDESKSAYGEVRKRLHEKLSKQRRAGDPDSMRAAAELGLLAHDLAADAAANYTRAKRERGVLDNDDLLREAHRLITAPDLAEARDRAATATRVLLVDEFQDTDALQSELVSALAAGGAARFTVGDFKQSIYRFRGAEPEVFNRLRAATPPAGRLSLSLNFRSQPGVLRFVNELFAPAFGELYQPLRAHRAALSDAPAAEFLWTPPPEGDAGRPPSADARRTAEAEQVAAWIAAAIESGAPRVVDKQTGAARGPRAGDFAVLLRALSDVATYEDALRSAGLEYYLVGGHAFYSQQEVYDLLNLLRAVLSGCDDIALAGVLRSPMFGLPDEALYWLSRAGSLNAGLASEAAIAAAPIEFREPIRDAARVVARLRSEKDRLGAAELVDLAWSLTAYDATLLAEFLGERKLANLEKLQEQARQADASGSGLVGFARRLGEFVKQPPKEALAATTAGDAEVVRVMTVHAAKGLEFPIVVLPDLNRKEQADRTQATFDPALGPLMKPPSTSAGRDDSPPVGLDFWRAVEKQAEQAERVRLFYVACTRAADHLVLSACYDPGEKAESPWLKLLAERFDLATGRLLDTGGGSQTVRVAELSPRAGGGGEREKSELHKALESLRDNAPRPAAAPPGVAALELDAKAAVAFSVSRLSGRLQSAGSRRSFDDESAPRQGVDPRRLGSLVHAAIERLPQDATREAIGPLIDDLAPLHVRRDIEATVAEARRQVAALLRSRAWRGMATSDDLRREVEFFLPWPLQDSTAMLRGYFDALWRDEEGRWRLADYKTNRVAADRVPQFAEPYRFQMAVYAHAIEAATGQAPAALTLVFLSPGVEVDVPWDERAREASRALISEKIAERRRELADDSIRSETHFTTP